MTSNIPTAVIGNGIIGHGVAQVLATAGHPVVMIGRNAASLDKAQQNIRESLGEFVCHGLVQAAEVPNILVRITNSTILDDAKSAGFVVEAVTENLEL